MALLAMLLCNPAWAAKEEITDDLLYDRVNRALITDRVLGTGQLTLEVKDGNVKVGGLVETEKQRERVDKIVKKVKGVRKIDNKVEVRR